MKTLFFALLLSSLPLMAAPQIDTIQLNHRLAVELLPEIQALLPEETTARAFNNLIIVKAEPKELKQITQLIRQLDTPPQRLEVTVVKTARRLHDIESQQISTDLNIRDRDLTGHVAIHSWSTQDSKQDEQFFQAQGVADKPIVIKLGEAIPQTEQYLVLRNDGDLAVQTETDYLNIDHGFNAVARILPNHHVTLDIHPRFSERSDQTGVIRSSEVITRLTGPAGTWLELGQIDTQKDINQYGTTRYQTHQKQHQYIYIKVDAIDRY